MPGYVKKALKKFNHKPPKLPEHAPHNWTGPIYGQQTQQRATQASTAPLLTPNEKQRIQVIVGTFLYYGIGIDSPILVTLNKIGSQQSTSTTDTEKNAQNSWTTSILTLAQSSDSTPVT